MNNNMEVNNNVSKKGNSGVVLLAVILLGLIVIGSVIILNKPDKGNNNSNSNSNSNIPSSPCISGKFVNGEDTINTYCSKVKRYGYSKEVDAVVYVKDIEDEGILSQKGTAYFNGDVAEYMGTSFEFKDGKLLYGKDKKEFTKVGDYSKDEYAKEVYNIDTTLFNGKYNNSYKKGNSMVIMYPVSNDKIVFYYSSSSKDVDNVMFTNDIGMASSGSFNGVNTYFCFLNLNTDGSYSYENTSFGKTTKVKVVFGTNNVNISYSSTDTDKNSKYDDLNGTFNKVKTLSTDDILNNKFE